MTMQPPHIRRSIEALGRDLTPETLPAVFDIFQDEQQQIASRFSAAATDLPYGPDTRHKLDVYTPQNNTSDAVPILVFVHGGGFLKGDKGSAENWKNANVGIMASRAGFMGMVINYRLAPDHEWPAGGEDVAAVVEWIKNNASNYGGDPEKIILVGTSAGAVHLATYLKLQPENNDVRGMVMLSGLYGITPLDERDTIYYGDHSLYPQRWPLEAVIETDLPIFLVCAEFDPPRFQAEFLGLLHRRLERHGATPRATIVTGHNHYSLAMHLGTSDTRLSDEIVAFVEASCG